MLNPILLISKSDVFITVTVCSIRLFMVSSVITDFSSPDSVIPIPFFNSIFGSSHFPSACPLT